MLLQVFVGSASDGLLMPGDKLVGINHQDTSRMTHLEAQNLIKSSGPSAKIDVIRYGAVNKIGVLTIFMGAFLF